MTWIMYDIAAYNLDFIKLLSIKFDDDGGFFIEAIFNDEKKLQITDYVSTMEEAKQGLKKIMSRF